MSNSRLSDSLPTSIGKGCKCIGFFHDLIHFLEAINHLVHFELMNPARVPLFL